MLPHLSGRRWPPDGGSARTSVLEGAMRGTWKGRPARRRLCHGRAAGDEVVTELTELFATRGRAEWMEALAGMDVCVGPVNNFSEAFSDEQAVHRGMVVDVEVPGAGVWRHIGDPIRLQEAPGSIDRLPPPKMGEATEQVLSECRGHLRGGRFPRGHGGRSDASRDRRTDLARSGGRCLHQGDAGPRASQVPETSTELPPSNPDEASCRGFGHAEGRRASPAKIVDWLDEMKPSLPKGDLRALRIAAVREDGWAEALASRSTPAAPHTKAEPVERLTGDLERERAKVKRARGEPLQACEGHSDQRDRFTDQADRRPDQTTRRRREGREQDRYRSRDRGPWCRRGSSYGCGSFRPQGGTLRSRRLRRMPSRLDPSLRNSGAN